MGTKKSTIDYTIIPDNVYRACAAKKYFPNEIQAVKFAVNYSSGMVFSCYECDYCDGYHLTTQKPNITREYYDKLKAMVTDRMLLDGANHARKYKRKKNADHAARDMGEYAPVFCGHCKSWHISEV